ncbi:MULTISPECIES: hypothetical protein [Actinoalloteichus]|uniref:Uncharacterized protein n=1 Tax=Actinoalloteichus fjordicus TaxID=1612552 RepID=A0AAC9LBN0_9PSEU|nr:MULTISPECIES: hypothetical protein [Actinoalloteichus]APU14803.1 hypothetical protein UA74_13725 [Actinoalloteichus fjordicus]APU20774.1 hypothetical protein UA75_13820 [Actinoalloteichus sp. GBA129-24]
MSADSACWFTQDALPQAGLCLDRHLVWGRRPAEGTAVVAACGAPVIVSPSPACDVDGDLRLIGVRPCWYCVEQATGVPGPTQNFGAAGPAPPPPRAAGGDGTGLRTSAPERPPLAGSTRRALPAAAPRLAP